MTFEFCGNERENFKNRLKELPELEPGLTALLVPYNPIKEIYELTESLAILSLRGCEMTRLQCLLGCPNLIALDVSGNSLGHEGGMDLADYLAHNTKKLQKLHISACHIPISAMIHIVRALQDVESLQEVDMSRNSPVVATGNGELRASAATELHYHLENLFRSNSSLKTVNVGSMRLGDEGVAAILGGIAMNPRSAVAWLDLSGNGVTWQSARLLSKVLRASDRKPTLENLNLSGNRLGMNGTTTSVADLAHAITDKAHCGLKTLDLSRNQLTGDALVSILAAVAKSSLKKVRVFENTWNKDVAEKIAKIVDTCPVELDIALQRVDDNVYVVRK